MSELQQKREQRFVIVTGMSGAGKSSALKMLEDAGYFCVDNLPVPLIGKFVELAFGKDTDIRKVALGIDIRSGQTLKQLASILDSVKDHQVEVLFLDASTETLVRRFKETRRLHPLSGVDGMRVDKGIEQERKQLSFLRERADYIIDTSRLLVRELKTEIDRIFVRDQGYQNFYITIVSFGFKHGIPADADLIFDVRFLPNPYYIPELKPLTGNDAPVYDYVMASPLAGEFLGKLMDMLEFLIPNYIREGKNQLIIGIGCTGGQHRSVTIANALKAGFDETEYGCKVEHRDANAKKPYV